MDSRRDDLSLLRSLDVLLGERNVTRAAERLGISQPALSARLERLREMFDDPLLVPSGRRMVLSPLAETLAGPLRRALEDLSDLVRSARAFDPATDARTVRISGTDYLHRVATFPLVESLAREAPNLRVAMLGYESDRAWSRLENDEVDLVLTSDALRPEAADSRKLFDERFVVVRRRGHPSAPGPVDLDAFVEWDQVLVSPVGGGFVGATDAALAERGLSRRVAVSVPSFLLAPALVAASDRIAVVPERLAIAAGDVVERFEPPLPIPGFAAHVCWHPRRRRDPAHIWLRRRIVEVTRGDDRDRLSEV